MIDTKEKTKSARKVDGKTDIYMNLAYKERFKRIEDEHGLSLSPFFRLVASKYIEKNGWK